MNFSDKPSKIFLKKEYTELTELIKEEKLERKVNLDPFEVLILV